MSQPLLHGRVSAIQRFLPLFFVLFVGSGCAALIYEIVWFQLLQFVIGSSAVSLGVLLGTFMGGMCLGSLLLPRLIGRGAHPLYVYALLEFGIGVCGVAVIYGLPILDAWYIASAREGSWGLLQRELIAAACLLPPTILMGATLPAVARAVEATPQGVSWLGFFYGGNLFGAVVGCFLAGFYLLRVHDLITASYVAVAINTVIGFLALLAAPWLRYSHSASAATNGANSPPPKAKGIYLAIGLSGLSALGAEVIWTRLLSLFIGGTVYTFSIILGIFLVGLGLGSSAGSWIARSGISRLALAICQCLLAVAIAWTAYQLTCSIPFWPIDPALPHDPWLQFQLDIVRIAWAILPGAFLWGASFPLAIGATAQLGQDPGRMVGAVYAANTVGAIVGALAFSIWMVPIFGTQTSQQLIAVLSLVSATIVFIPLLKRHDLRDSLALDAPQGSHGRIGMRMLGGFLALAVAAGLIKFVPKTSGELIAHGRYLPRMIGKTKIIYYGEGRSSSVAVGEDDALSRTFHVSGKVEASSMGHDMRLQRMLGHLPALAHAEPKSVLIVGCGAGVTAGSFVVHPSIQRIVICELEPLIPQAVAPFFAKENHAVINDPRVQIVFDDARHFVLTTKESFDIITSDPIHPWVKGAAALYTKEYFEMCKQRLKPGGVISQWVPLYESNTEAVKSELATFFEVFPRATVWGNDQGGFGYDVVLLGQAGELRIDVERLNARMQRADHEQVADSLQYVGLHSVIDLLGTYAGSSIDLRNWLKDAEINRDRNLRLQYLAGMGSSKYWEAAIYAEMIRSRTYPEAIFVTDAASREQLEWKLAPP